MLSAPRWGYLRQNAHQRLGGYVKAVRSVLKQVLIPFVVFVGGVAKARGHKQIPPIPLGEFKNEAFVSIGSGDKLHDGKPSAVHFRRITLLMKGDVFGCLGKQSIFDVSAPRLFEELGHNSLASSG